VSCTVCGVETEKTDRCEDAVSDWNDGAVFADLSGQPANRQQQTSRR
jgi:hypothetical protein